MVTMRAREAQRARAGTSAAAKAAAAKEEDYEEYDGDIGPIPKHLIKGRPPGDQAADLPPSKELLRYVVAGIEGRALPPRRPLAYFVGDDYGLVRLGA